MGPVPGGNLSTLPNSWEDAKVLRGEIDKIWKKLTSQERIVFANEIRSYQQKGK